VSQPREVVTEVARHERTEEARFQALAGSRRIQGQRGIQVQRARGIAFHARIQRVQQSMRLADAQWRAEPQRAVDPRQHEVDRGVEGIEHVWVGHGPSIASPAERLDNIDYGRNLYKSLRM